MNSAGSIVQFTDAGTVTELVRGSGLIPPVIDRAGWVFTGAQQNDGTVTITTDGSDTRTIAVPWLL
ncbi:MAG: hypothetical protein Q4Q03_00695, partial [Bowdeniella nasicola]|nr:hypothetical protein [Bowdeniella nasicola]